jgi:hypothetical protein
LRERCCGHSLDRIEQTGCTELMANRAIESLMGAIGIIGAIASIIALPPGPTRLTFVSLFVLCFAAAAALFISARFDLVASSRILHQCKKLGINRIFGPGQLMSESNMPERLAKAKTIRICIVSGDSLIRTYKTDLVIALQRAAVIKVLHATHGSQFVSDCEIMESPTRVGHIHATIRQVEALLEEILTEARAGMDNNVQCGRILIGHYTTHLRASLTIADNHWGWYTPNLPPKRAIEMPSFELKATPTGLLTNCLKHFDRVWELVEAADGVVEVKGGH